MRRDVVSTLLEILGRRGGDAISIKDVSTLLEILAL